mmetsp:Transcript_54482/g.117955  ORF Transcript_54482/g.117955 Transcript_54482/m.117955 type:complete len:389 (+) Transcript_54482:29-1195(+)
MDCLEASASRISGSGCARLRTLLGHVCSVQPAAHQFPRSLTPSSTNGSAQSPPLSWCVVGAGAIGGLVGARLAQAGETVTLLARRQHLAAMQGSGGLLVKGLDGSEVLVPVRAVSSCAEAGPVDVVVVALKAHQILPMLEELPKLFHSDTIVLSMQNGLPWWYFLKHGGPLHGRALNSVDPDGRILAAIDPERIVGCVPYPAAHLRAPGEVQHTEGTLLPLGELDGKVTPRVQRVSASLVRAGFKAPVLENIRANIWVKLLGNLCFNPIAALTHSTLDVIATYPPSVTMVRASMEEAAAIARSLGVTLDVTVERRIAGAAKVKGHKPSTLQDVEAGKPTEVDALIVAVVELAELTGTPAPTIRTLAACMQLLNKTVEEKGVRIQSSPA